MFSHRKLLFVFTAVLGLWALCPASFARKGAVEEQPDVMASGDISTTVTNHGRSIATITNQVNEMVGQFQDMNGEIQKNAKKNVDQDKILKDVQMRLQTVEDKISLLTNQMQELRAEGLLKPTATQRYEEFRNYSKALEYVNARNYTKAISELQSFMAANKSSAFADYAQYWIGESYYLQADYEMAITEYQKVMSKNAKSPKAPSAIYKQGMAFFHLQSFNDAKEFFSKVIRTYPQSIEAVQASSQIARINTIMDLRQKASEEEYEVENAL